MPSMMPVSQPQVLLEDNAPASRWGGGSHAFDFAFSFQPLMLELKLC